MPMLTTPFSEELRLRMFIPPEWQYNYSQVRKLISYLLLHLYADKPIA
jgi:hypothetical protein